MGMMDKFMNVIRLNADDDEEIYEDEFYDEEMDDFEDEAPKKVSPLRKSEPLESSTNRFSSRNTSVEPARPVRQASDGSMEVCVIKPTSLEDGREITETLLNGRTVVLNLEGVDLDLGQRIIDFTSGSCYALKGNLQKITNYIFIVTPEDVDISGDFQSLMSHFDMSSFHADI